MTRTTSNTSNTVKGYCADSHFASLNPRSARIRSLNGLLAGEPLTLRYYRDAGLQDWVNRICQTREIDSDRDLLFSHGAVRGTYPPRTQGWLTSSMSIQPSGANTPPATNGRCPGYTAAKGRLLLDFERETAATRHAPSSSPMRKSPSSTAWPPSAPVRVDAICNGVDADYFAPDDAFTSPYAAGEVPSRLSPAPWTTTPTPTLRSWFAKEVCPARRRGRPRLGSMSSGEAHAGSAGPGRENTSPSPAPCPMYAPTCNMPLLVVAPLRIARGIQNKILEAMAMAKAVVASSECAGPVDAATGEELLQATTPDDYVTAIDRLLSNPEQAASIGQRARKRVLARYSWEAHLSGIDRYLPDSPGKVSTMNQTTPSRQMPGQPPWPSSDWCWP